MPDDTLPSAVQKRLNRSRRRLGCGLGLAQGSMYEVGRTLPPPGEYNCTSMCAGNAAFLSTYFDHLVYTSRQKVPILYNGLALSPQNCPFSWKIWTPSNTRLLVPTRIHNPNGISIGSAVFAALTIVTDRQTDRQRDHGTLSYCDAA